MARAHPRHCEGVRRSLSRLRRTVTIGNLAAELPRNVRRARHAVSRDATRKFFQYVPLKGDKGQVVEMLFSGSHSDVGGLYDDNPLVADLALAWIAAGAKREGLRFRRTARLSQKLDATAVVLYDPHGESSNLCPVHRSSLLPTTTQPRQKCSTTIFHPSNNHVPATSQPSFGSNTRTTRFRLNLPTSLIRHLQPILKNKQSAPQLFLQPSNNHAPNIFQE